MEIYGREGGSREQRGGAVVEWYATETAPPKGQIRLSAKSKITLRDGELTLQEAGQTLVLRAVAGNADVASWCAAMTAAAGRL